MDFGISNVWPEWVNAFYRRWKRWKEPKYTIRQIIKYTERAKDGDWKRTHGESLCPVCHRPHREHPHAPVLDFNESPWLTVLCDDSLVKL